MKVLLVGAGSSRDRRLRTQRENQATDFSGKPVLPGNYVLEGYFIDVAAVAGAELIIQ